jgi:hypothetical protein
MVLFVKKNNQDGVKNILIKQEVNDGAMELSIFGIQYVVETI